MAFRPRGRHGETLHNRQLAVPAPSVPTQNRRSDRNEQTHPGESRQNQPLVKSLTALSDRLFQTPPARKTPTSMVRANPSQAAKRLRKH
jgi:hypothetical protein